LYQKNVFGLQLINFIQKKAWPLLKAYLIVTVANQFTSYLSDELRVLGGQYQRELTGLPEAMASQKAAVYLAAQPFNQAIGVIMHKIIFHQQLK
jgi:putative endopeptidase